MLLLVMATSQLRCYKNLSQLFKTVQTRKHEQTLISRGKCSDTLPLPFMYSCQTISRTRKSHTKLDLWKIVPETVFGFGWRFQTSFRRRSPNIYPLWRVIRWSFQSFADSSCRCIVERHM